MYVFFNFIIKVIWFLINYFQKCHHKGFKGICAIDIFFTRNLTHKWYICQWQLFQLFNNWTWILHILFKFIYVKVFPLINNFFVKSWPTRWICSWRFRMISFLLHRKSNIVILDLHWSFLSSKMILWLDIRFCPWNTNIQCLVFNSVKIDFGFLWKHIASWIFRKNMDIITR